MTKDERQSLILDLLMQQDSLLVTDLSEQLNVSSVTIRKDLTELEKKKKLYRNHGKAILIDPYSENKNVSEKERLYVEEKRLIGAAAAQLVTPRDSILIASGTTVHALARNIHTTDKLTVITASLEVARILANDHNVDIIELGGILRHSSLSVVGKYAESALNDFSCIQIRTPRLQQDRRHKRRGPHHHRLAHLSVNGTRHRGDGHRADNCSCPLTSNQAQIIKAIPGTIVSGIAFIIPIYTD